MKQSRAMSLIEAVTNVVVGYGLAELTTEISTAVSAVMVDVASVYRDALAAISGRPVNDRADAACARATGATTNNAAP